MRSSLPTLSLVALCLSLGARAAPFTTRSQQLQEGGCYKDDLTNRVLGSNGPQGRASISDVSMSIERCKQYCFSAVASDSYRYAGVEWGRECFCGNDFLTDLDQTYDFDCAGMPCTGNGGEYCGNANRIQIFSRDHWDPLSTASDGTSTDVTSASTLSLTTSGASAGSTAGPVSSVGEQGFDDDDSTDANKAATTSAATSVATSFATTYSTFPDSSATGQVSSQATSAGTTSQATSSQATSQATSSQATSSQATTSQTTTSQTTTSQSTTSQATSSQSSSSQAASSQGSKTTISSI